MSGKGSGGWGWQQQQQQQQKGGYRKGGYKGEKTVQSDVGVYILLLQLPLTGSKYSHTILCKSAQNPTRNLWKIFFDITIVDYVSTFVAYCLRQGGREEVERR